MPDRLIREGLKSSRRIGQISEAAECLFFRLLLTVCPLGRYDADPQLVRSAAVPNRPRKRTSDIASALEELQRAGLIVRYAAPDGAPLLYIPRFGQRLKYAARSPYPPPPSGPADAPGQELLPWINADPPVEEKRRESPQSPPAGGLSNRHGSSDTPRRRSPGRTLSKAREELAEVEQEMQEILRPGGCAYNVTPTGAKAVRLEKLKAQREALKKLIAGARKELAATESE